MIVWSPGGWRVKRNSERRAIPFFLPRLIFLLSSVISLVLLRCWTENLTVKISPNSQKVSECRNSGVFQQQNLWYSTLLFSWEKEKLEGLDRLRHELLVYWVRFVWCHNLFFLRSLFFLSGPEPLIPWHYYYFCYYYYYCFYSYYFLIFLDKMFYVLSSCLIGRDHPLLPFPFSLRLGPTGTLFDFCRWPPFGK